MFTKLANITFDDLEMAIAMIQVTDPSDHMTIDGMADTIQRAFPYVTVTKAYEENSGGEDGDDKITKILNKVFYGLIGVTMFLCFFSLCAAMSANLYEQKKEVGVLRAMGFTKYRVRMLYFYEALILVMSSCILGVLIGTIVGYTMLAQFNLFLQQSTPAFFPWQQLLLVILISIVCAFFSTWGPAASLTNRSIAGIFRLV